MHIVGIVTLIVGIVFLLLGLNASKAITEKIFSGFTGHFTQNTRLYMFSGIVLIITGAILLFFGGLPQK